MNNHREQLFYCTRIEGDTISLEDQEAVHCSLVLRKRQGDIIHVIDGKGGLYKAGIDRISKREVVCTILDSKQEENPNKLILAVAPTKNRDRLEWMIEKVVEIGIKELIFVYTEHSERVKVNMERVLKKTVGAMKQSLRLHLPKVSESNLSELVSKDFEHKYIAHCIDDSPKQSWQKVQGECLVIIGPEGDFSLEEVNLAYSNGFKGLDLGKYRLRTETAAISAAVLFNQL
ncbi:MAG: 16S rRNA (uracil(1498)-N(3))-methyltransferase [Bacteroidia bacterium]